MDENKVLELIEKQMAAIEEKVNKNLNSAISTHLKRANEKTEKSIEALTSTMSQIADQIGRTADAPISAPTAPVAGQTQVAPTDNPVLVQLQNKLVENERAMKRLEEQAKQKDEAAQKAEAARRDTEARAKLSEALRSAGVRDGMIRAAVADLYVDRKVVRYNEDGDLVFLHQGAVGPEERPLDKGAAGWVEGEGKEYLPPRPTSGTGATGGSVSPAKGKGGFDAITELNKLF